MMVRVTCKHWEFIYTFEVDGEIATPLTYFDGGRERLIANPIAYDTETLKDNACEWEVVDDSK